MADRVIRGYWDCPQCGTTGIDGLVDVCPEPEKTRTSAII